MTTMILALALAVGCGNGKLDATHPLGTSTIASSRSGDRVFAVNTVDGTISQLDVATGATIELVVGLEPTRIARLSGERMAVTLRGERAVAIIDISGSKPVVQRKVPVGAEPYGIVAPADGSVVYVALSQQNEVVELDGENLAELRSWTVRGDPRWIALHPSEQALFVASAFGARLSRIDLTDHDKEVFDLPVIQRETKRSGWYDLTPRITGDITVSPLGDVLLVPTFYVDNESGPSPSLDGAGQVPYYASSSVGISRMNPALIAFRLDGRDGQLTDLAPLPISLIGSVDSRKGETVRSYPSSVVMSPNGTQAIVTMEGSDVLIGVNILPSRGQESRPSTFMWTSDPDFDNAGDLFTGIVEAGFFQRSLILVDATGGPIGMTFLSDDVAMVHTALDRTIGVLDVAALTKGIEDESANDGRSTDRKQSVSHVVEIAESSLTTKQEAGRRLFYSAIETSMSADGSGVSCATCHFEGRNDGLTWTFEFGLRQTPSLAGVVSETEPVSLTFDVPNTAEEAILTSRDRMGGGGLTPTQAAQIDAWVDRTVEVDVADKGLDNDVVALGREVFNRSEVGCSECHSGARFTDNQSHDIFGVENVNTPSLIGIAATAPYFHDGSMATLRTLIERVRDGSMGDTSSLDEGEMDALEQFLRAL